MRLRPAIPLLCSALAAFATPPAMFRGNAAHTGVYASPAPTLATVAWTFRSKGRILSSPVVSEGRVYVGSADHRVYALDAADGTVFIGSWDRNLYALDAGTGTQRWSFTTGDDTGIFNQVGIASSAAVAGGMVFFGCRDGRFYALDAKTGAQRWSHDNHKGWVIASPAVLGGRVYFPTSDGRRFKALDTRTGAVAFDLENRAISFSSPALAGGTAYFGSSDGWLHAVDLSTGKARGAFQTEGNRENGSRYLDDKGAFNHAAMYPDHTLEGMFIGMDRMFSLGAVLSSPAISEGVLYVGSADGRLYALK